jgi:hypothetical protein
MIDRIRNQNHAGLHQRAAQELTVALSLFFFLLTVLTVLIVIVVIVVIEGGIEGNAVEIVIGC